MFFGNSADIAGEIRYKMLDVLYSKEEYEFLDDNSKLVLAELRQHFNNFKIENTKNQRPVLIGENKQTFCTFTSSKINKTISFLLDQNKIEHRLEDFESSIIIDDLEHSPELITTILKNINTNEINHRLGLLLAFEEGQQLLDFSKWAIYLPLEMQIELIKTSYFDFEGAKLFGENIKFV